MVLCHATYNSLVLYIELLCASPCVLLDNKNNKKIMNKMILLFSFICSKFYIQSSLHWKSTFGNHGN